MLPVLAVLLAAVLFGTTGTAQALAHTGAEPVSVGAARILVGGTLLALIALGHRMLAPDRRRPATPLGVPGSPRRVPWWCVLLLGALGVLAYQPAFFAGTAANGVAVGTVVALGSAPVLTGLLVWLLGGRAPGAIWTIATALALVGVTLISGVLSPGGAADGGGSPSAAGVGIPGLLASMGAGAAYAVYTLAGKALLDRGWSSTGTMGGIFGLAAVLSIPVLLTGGTAWLATPAGLASALWLGVVTTAIAYLLFGWGLSRLAAPTVSTLTLMEPLTAAVLGVLLLGEVLAPAAAVGLAVLALGILLLTLPRRARVR